MIDLLMKLLYASDVCFGSADGDVAKRSQLTSAFSRKSDHLQSHGMSCCRRMQNVCLISGSTNCEKHVVGLSETHNLLSKCIFGMIVIGEGGVESGE